MFPCLFSIEMCHNDDTLFKERIDRSWEVEEGSSHCHAASARFSQPEEVDRNRFSEIVIDYSQTYNNISIEF